MPNVMNCPLCGKKLAVPDNAAGKNVRCPSCQQVFAVPSIQAAAPAPAPPPLPPPQAVTAEPPAPPRRRREPEPADDEEYEDERPRRRRREARDVAPLKFVLKVKSDPDRQLKGVFNAEVTGEGLKLKQGKKHNFLVPIGSRAAYEGKNLLALEIDEREVTFNLALFGSYQHRLAKDVVAYLKGKKERLNPARYKLEWYLLAPAVLPLGILIFAQVGAIPWGTAFGGMGACVAVAQQDKWPVAARLAAMVGVTVIAYAVFFALIFLIFHNLQRW